MTQCQVLMLLQVFADINHSNPFGFFLYLLGLHAKKQSVTELVQVLEPALCAKENDIRLMGTQFFVDVLNALHCNELNENEVQVIWNFFTDRLNDHHSIIPTIMSGGLSLSKNHSSSYKGFADFLRKLFQCIVCQTQKREDREKIFEMLMIASKSKAEGTVT